MDALARVEPVARPLLRWVDQALATVGAPRHHQVWDLLRRVGATPGDAVTFFAELGWSPADPARPGAALRAAAEALREQAEVYRAAALPGWAGGTAGPAWQGRASEAFAVCLANLDRHLRGTGRADAEVSMVSRMADTAGYLDEVARWQDHWRHRMAGTLAEILTSTQAVTIRLASRADPIGGVGVGHRTDLGHQTGEVVLAAADVGACVLDTAARAVDDGQDLHRGWTDRLAQLPDPPPVATLPGAEASGRGGATVWVRW